MGRSFVLMQVHPHDCLPTVPLCKAMATQNHAGGELGHNAVQFSVCSNRIHDEMGGYQFAKPQQKSGWALMSNPPPVTLEL